ncbi:nucleotide exchange factor GrpE [Deinococcus sonorensis]|uniref:Protein GrpE n=2 Tax=Deinococcus sonorensis TaxID=309891 RepID=A0AAU7UB40_9DEIO
MTDPQNPNGPQDPNETIIDAEVVDEQTTDDSAGVSDDSDFDPSMFNPEMFAQVQQMMENAEKAETLERENAELKNRLGRLAADFEAYRRRTADDASEARGKGTADAAEALMPVYDDLSRAIEMGSSDPGKLIPGMKTVQATVLRVFGQLGLEATGQEGEHFDPQWHEALQVVPGEQDDVVVQVYQVGFRMGDRLVRPARVVVSKKG